jgi:hypothetical protein
MVSDTWAHARFGTRRKKRKASALTHEFQSRSQALWEESIGSGMNIRRSIAANHTKKLKIHVSGA